MPKYSTESIRTVALVGHTGAGKTTLAEALLAKAGAIASAGSVEKGNTVCDFDPLEKEYKHSLNSALVNFAWKNVHNPPDRYARVAGLHGAGDRRARRRRDGGDRGERRDRNPARHRPHAHNGRRSGTCAE